MKYQIVYYYPDNRNQINIPENWIPIGTTIKKDLKYSEADVMVVVCLEPLKE